MSDQNLPSGPRPHQTASIRHEARVVAPYGDPQPTFEQQSDGNDDFRIMLLKYIGLAIKYKFLITSIVAASLFCGFIATLMMTKIYTAVTTIKIDRVAPKVINSQVAQGLDAGNDPQFFNTQFELIKSRSMAERVVASMNLAQSDFVTPHVPTFIDNFIIHARSIPLLGQIFSAPPIQSDDQFEPGPVDQGKVRAAAGLVMGGLLVKPVRGSSLVEIQFSSVNPQWAQRVSVGIAEEYEKFILDNRFTTSKYARTFLEERLEELKLKLNESEKQLVQYEQREGVVSLDNKKPYSTSDVQAVQSALNAAKADRIKSEQIYQMSRSDDANALPQIANDTVIQEARGRIAQLQATYKEKLAVLKPAFPEMLALKAQISEAEKQINNQAAYIKKTIQAQYETAKAQEDALARQLDQAQSDLSTQRGRSIEYSMLLREVDTARSLYDGLLQQYKEMAVVSEVDTNNVSIIDRAETPSGASYPSLRMNLLTWLIIGLVLSVIAIAIFEVLDDTFKSPDDMEERLGIPVLGVMPMFHAKLAYDTPVKEILYDATSALSEAYRSLRTTLQFATEEGAPKSLLVTSARPGEGKSTASICLAANFGQLGKKVLLIDADLRNPSMHRVLELDNASGLSNYLSGSAEADKIFQSTQLDNVAVLTSGPLPPNPAELLAGARLPTLIAKASEVFDMVIIDGPPVMGLADALIISSVAQGVLFTVESTKTRRNIVIDALRRLEFARARVIGTMLNKFDARHSGYGYGYGYSYGYGHGYGYGYNRYLYGYGRKSEAQQVTDARRQA